MSRREDLHIDLDLPYDMSRFRLKSKDADALKLRLHAFGTRDKADPSTLTAHFAYHLRLNRRNRWWLNDQRLADVEAHGIDNHFCYSSFCHDLDQLLNAESRLDCVRTMLSKLDLWEADETVESWARTVSDFGDIAAMMAAMMGTELMIIVVELGVTRFDDGDEVIESEDEEMQVEEEEEKE